MHYQIGFYRRKRGSKYKCAGQVLMQMQFICQPFTRRYRTYNATVIRSTITIDNLHNNDVNTALMAPEHQQTRNYTSYLHIQTRKYLRINSLFIIQMYLKITQLASFLFFYTSSVMPPYIAFSRLSIQSVSQD